MFDPDTPINSAETDELGRAPFAKALAESIIAYTDPSSLVLGLLGAWGSGKTSILNMTIEQIEKKSIEPEKAPLILWFNPWNFSDQDQLVAQFFIQLSNLLDHSNHASNAKKVGKALRKYAKFFAPLRLVPVVGDYAELAQDAVSGVGDAIRGWGELKDADLNAQRVELNKLLKELDRKIIILVDDIDRLNKQEIRQIFQLVKLLADFPNTVYLLSFDKEVVKQALTDIQAGDANAYLEKIIQVEFDIPEVSKSDLDQYLFSHLDEILANFPQEGFDQGRWGNVYQGSLTKLFQSIRDINRFINTYRFGFGLIGLDLNPVDLISLTALKVLEPGVYSLIKQNRAALTRQSSSYQAATREDKEALMEIFVKAREKLDEQALTELMQRLFPTLENIGYGYDHWAQWRREARVCSPDFFDSYFKLSLPADDLSVREVEAVLATASDENEFKKRYKELVNDDRAPRFLERLEDYTDDLPLKNAVNLLGGIFDSSDALPQGKEGMFSFGNRLKVGRIMFQLLKRFPTQEERYGFLKDAIKNAPNALYILADEIATLGQEHGKRSSDKQVRPEKERSVNNKQLQDLERTVLGRIRERACRGEIPIDWRLKGLLYDWEGFASKTEPAAFFQDLISTNKNLLEVLQTFEATSYSQELGIFGLPDRVPRTHTTIDIATIDRFGDLGKITQRVRAITESADFTELDEPIRKTVLLFLELADSGEWKQSL